MNWKPEVAVTAIAQKTFSSKILIQTHLFQKILTIIDFLYQDLREDWKLGDSDKDF